MKNNTNPTGNQVLNEREMTDDPFPGYTKCECGMYLDSKWMKREPSVMKSHRRVFHK